MPEDRGEVTALLDELRNGHPEAESRLLELVYVRLKQLARNYMGRERPDHTFQATDLVHEAYLRMAGTEKDCRNRAHFFGVAAQAMRRILVDHARAHDAEKRGDGKKKISIDQASDQAIDQALFLSAADSGHLIEIDEALQKLARMDARQARIVELRFFAGLSIEETADALDISGRTIKREWRIAQAWLSRELSGKGRA